MTPGRLLDLAVTVTRVAATGAQDAYGNPTPVTTTAGPFRGHAWLVGANERTVDQDLQVQEWRVVLEAAAAGLVDGGDRLTFSGHTWEVIGPPWPLTNPRTGESSHVQLAARRSEG